MSTHELLYKAIKIATKAHKKQTDKYDAPYLGHVFRVMNAGKTIDEKIVGILHDVVEDHPEFSLEYLKEKGFPDYIIEAIECLTKREEEHLDYDAFIARIEKSPLAIAERPERQYGSNKMYRIATRKRPKTFQQISESLSLSFREILELVKTT